MKNKKSRNKSIREPLGHGDHWQAIFPQWNSHPEKTQQFITRLCKEATPRAKFPTPWPRPELDFNVIIRLGYKAPHFETAVLLTTILRSNSFSRGFYMRLSCGHFGDNPIQTNSPRRTPRTRSQKHFSVLSAYLSSLGAYTPKKGDLVQGVVWLQGKLY
ncbi:MAG: hypothetical protein LBM04_11125 [Opitutaceae bacterium]|jgi:hypothetical protein|nr:hypothetical protein [Opitutaceae bacterium]